MKNNSIILLLESVVYSVFYKLWYMNNDVYKVYITYNSLFLVITHTIQKAVF